MCVATYLKSGSPSAPHGTPSPSSLTTRYCKPRSRPRSMTTVLARASMLFSINSAMAFRGLLWERAMMRMAFQSSPIRNLPLSDALLLAALFLVTGQRVEHLSERCCHHQPLTISRTLLVGNPWPQIAQKKLEAKPASNGSTLRWAQAGARPLSDEHHA
jgi:hypothetical protein